MKNRILLSIFAVVLSSSLTGCIVHTQPRGRSARRGCGPAYHWDGRECVHNGNGHKSHKSNHGHRGD